MNVEYASWLKATYGFSESIRELVPSLNTPPLLSVDPCASETATTAAAARPASTTARTDFMGYLLVEPTLFYRFDALVSTRGSAKVRPRAAAAMRSRRRAS